jgi:F0F1-type ATP synthase assembly protein I
MADKKSDPLAVIARYSGLAIMLPAATMVGYGIGYGLDVFFSTHYLKIVFLLIGTVAGFIELIRGLTKGPD